MFFASLLSMLISEFSVSRMQVKRNCTMNMNQVRVRAGLQVHNFDFFSRKVIFFSNNMYYLCAVFEKFILNIIS